MTTRKKKTPTRKAVLATELTNTEVEVLSKSKITKEKEVDFNLVQQVLSHSGLKYGETANDKISIIAIKFYQRINKLPITGKLDSATLKKMGL